ncbi:hypothetical protein GMOD_00002598 [Pyrenophora seminiperda CCB06]|uniref:Uncharacterized protein n=1 Tax=Pyrenophora seminiperda CCB06 TaxID=1302712 RepID=A0A3M7M2Q5_9PLEO|nr:hypothetical protein GMOD_00002598 [Pyrenophora seminiperda CCB06]
MVRGGMQEVGRTNGAFGHAPYREPCSICIGICADGVRGDLRGAERGYYDAKYGTGEEHIDTCLVVSAPFSTKLYTSMGFSRWVYRGDMHWSNIL